MRIKNMLVQLIYRAVWAIVGIVATVFTFLDHVGANGDGRPVALFFTTWSVWLSTLVAVVVFGATLYRFIKGEREGYNRAIPLLKFASDIMIIATFIVGGFVLHLFFDSAGSVFKHFLLPIITVVDAVLFDPKNSYRISYPFLGVVLPLLYWVVVVIRMVAYTNGVTVAQTADVYGRYFPYGFTNLLSKDPLSSKYAIPTPTDMANSYQPGGHTVGGLCGMLGGIMVGLILIGFIFWALDKLSMKNKKITFDAKVNEETTPDIIHLIKNKK